MAVRTWATTSVSRNDLSAQRANVPRVGLHEAVIGAETEAVEAVQAAVAAEEEEDSDEAAEEVAAVEAAAVAVVEDAAGPAVVEAVAVAVEIADKLRCLNK